MPVVSTTPTARRPQSHESSAVGSLASGARTLNFARNTMRWLLTFYSITSPAVASTGGENRKTGRLGGPEIDSQFELAGC